MGELADFRSRCGLHVAARDTELAAQQHKRGLSIQWVASPKQGVFTNLWGAGHTLPVACRLHQLCRRMRRFCYLSVYDTSFEDYFGYANGLSWKPRRMELARYANKRSIELRCNASRHRVSRRNASRLRYEPFIEGELLRAIEAADDAALVKVTVRGWMPMTDVLSYTQAHLPEEESLCDCRYVTEPLHKQRPALARWLYSGADSLAQATALHLRTGFADISSELMLGLRGDAAATARYVAAACGPDPFADGALRFAMSDSPGLLRHLRARYPHVGANEPPENTTTRSWFTSLDVKFAAYDDLVVAGAAARIQIAPQQRLSQRARHTKMATQYSGFARAVLARSVRLRVVQAQVPECPRYARVFPRDYPTGLEAFLFSLGIRARDVRAGALDAGATMKLPVGRKRAKQFAHLATFQSQLATFHPCRQRVGDCNGTDPRSCLLDAVGALK